MKLKNKKAIVLPETLKIIIGVLCIIILIYLAYQLYNLFLTKTDLEQARETLKQIVDRIEGLEEGKEESYLITAPKEWYIVSYTEGETSPSQCNGKNCLCVCPEKSDVLFLLDFVDQTNYFNEEKGLLKCEKEGICKVSKEKIEFGELESEFQQLTWGVKEILTYVNFISLLDVPKNIYLKKEGEKIILAEKSSKSPKPIIDWLLKTKIDFNGEKLTFEDFVLKYIANDCENEEFKASSDVIKKTEKEIEEYLSELKFEDKEASTLYIRISKIKNKEREYLVKGWVSLVSTYEEKEHVTENKILCKKNDLIYYIDYIGTFLKEK